MSNPKVGSAGPVWVRDNSNGAAQPTFIVGALVFPATVNLAQPAGLGDGEESQLSVDASGNLRITPGTGVTFPSVPFSAQSVAGTGRVVGIAANTPIATILAASLPAGTYALEFTTVLDAGAPAAADANNMQLLYGATQLMVIQVDISGLTHPNQSHFQAILAGGSNLTINSIGAGTAGVGYNAQLVATRIA